MDAITLQIFINSGVFVPIMVRYALQMIERGNRWRIGAFLTTVVFVNIVLLMDRFETFSVLYKAGMIALGFFVGTLVMAHFKKPEIK